MADRPIRMRIPRPSDDGYETTVNAYHRCEQARVLTRQGVKEPDLLSFWPFPYMAGMQTGVPVAVQSEQPCGACGRYVNGWFEWKSSLVLP